MVLGEEIALADVLAVARTLLRANYDLSDVEVADLVNVEPGPEAEALARAVLECGVRPRSESPVDMPIGSGPSLLANGLAASSRYPASAIK